MTAVPPTRPAAPPGAPKDALETPIPPPPLGWDPFDTRKRVRRRPTLFEAKPEAWPRLIWAIRQGNTFQAAAGFAGLSRAVLAKAMQRGREAQRRREGGPWREFMDAIDQAVAVSEVMHVGYITLAGREGAWKASAFLLGVRNPARYAPTRRVAHTGPDFKEPVVFEMKLPNTRPGLPTAEMGQGPAALLASGETAEGGGDEGVQDEVGEFIAGEDL